MVAALQRGHGAPAPPQPQACGPVQDWSGWVSQTQPLSSQARHLLVIVSQSGIAPNRPPRLLLPMEIPAHIRAALAAGFADEPMLDVG